MEWRKLHDKELNGLHCSPAVIRLLLCHAARIMNTFGCRMLQKEADWLINA